MGPWNYARVHFSSTDSVSNIICTWTFKISCPLFLIIFYCFSFGIDLFALRDNSRNLYHVTLAHSGLLVIVLYFGLCSAKKYNSAFWARGVITRASPIVPRRNDVPSVDHYYEQVMCGPRDVDGNVISDPKSQ